MYQQEIKLVKDDNFQVTRVLFRVWQDSIIALFPDIVSTFEKHECLSYEHVGQHGTADLAGILQDSRNASESEYKALKTELESRGYVLLVVDSLPKDSAKIRQKTIDNFINATLPTMYTWRESYGDDRPALEAWFTKEEVVERSIAIASMLDWPEFSRVAIEFGATKIEVWKMED